MKTAKEWAAEMVTDSGWIEDGEAAVAMCQASQVEKARAIIERLVELAQDDILDEFGAYFREQERSLYDGERLDFDYCIARFRERIGGDK